MHHLEIDNFLINKMTADYSLLLLNFCILTTVTEVFTNHSRRRPVGKGEDLSLIEFYETTGFSKFGFQANINIFYLFSLRQCHNLHFGEGTVYSPPKYATGCCAFYCSFLCIFLKRYLCFLFIVLKRYLFIH